MSQLTPEDFQVWGKQKASAKLEKAGVSGPVGGYNPNKKAEPQEKQKSRNCEDSDEITIVAQPAKNAPQVNLSNPRFIIPAEGVTFNGFCDLAVDVEYLQETILSKVTFELRAIHNKKDELIDNNLAANENDGIAQVKARLYYHNDNRDDSASEYYFIARHSKGKKDARSCLITIPIEERFPCDFVDIPDILFNSDSAIPCLDVAGNLSSALATVFKYANDSSEKEAVLFGHTDISGKEEYNFDLSRDRCAAIKALIDNEDAVWTDVAQSRAIPEDYQQILKTLSGKYGWSCDPGGVDGKPGPKTKVAVEEFQREYNSRFGKNIAVDGTIGPQTWKAIFAVTRSILESEAKKATGSDSLPLIIYGYEGKGIYPCGESFPLEGIPGTDGKNRRVELCFFDKGKAPKLLEHKEKAKPVTKKENPVYDEAKTDRKIIKPVAIDSSPESNILLEFIFPIVNGSDRPHKQYVNIDSNGKNEGNELQIRVKPKDLKVSTDKRHVYWRVTAHESNSKRTDPKTGIKQKKTDALIEFKERAATTKTLFFDRESSIILVCGVAGGDRFTVEAGCDGKEYPLKMVVETWRNVWYQLTHEDGLAIPSLQTSSTAFEKVNIELRKDNEKTFKKADVPDRTYYKEWMFQPGGRDIDVAVIGSHNKEHFFELHTKNATCTPKAHLIICQQQWDEGEIEKISYIFTAKKAETLKTQSISIVKPALKGTVVVIGKWKANAPIGHSSYGRTGEVFDNCIVLERNRKSLNHFKRKRKTMG